VFHGGQRKTGIPEQMLERNRPLRSSNWLQQDGACFSRVFWPLPADSLSLIELFLDQSGQIHLLGLKVALRSGDNQNVFDRIFRIPG